MKNILGTPEDWKRLGFRCGIEVHHQIKTEKKLFCRCPAGPYSNEWHAEVLRHMRPTMSELGEYDGTALMEFKTKKEIIYRLHRDKVCTYEMDDNPPFQINEEAVDKALRIALTFKCKMVNELHVIRKQYLDGSIPAGFQRTCIIGVDGVLPLSNGKEVRIIQVGLEEDSCREISDNGHRIVFAVDRLGIPLIEVVTDKTFESPQEAAEGVQRIGRLLRATGYANRGIGAVRQDVNVSINGSTRVEIKGVPRIPRIPYLTAHEARRQESLLQIKDEMVRRGLSSGEFPIDEKKLEGNGISFHRPELKAAQMAGDTIRVIRLPESKGLLSWQLTGIRRFSDEFSGRVRVIACLDQKPNIFHTDVESAVLDDHDLKLINEFARCGKDDVAIVVWGPDLDTITAVKEIHIRWEEASQGVCNETRQALRDNTTDFERVLPGPDRMYPDTDSAPFEITREKIEAAEQFIPEYPWDREKRYLEMGLPEDISRNLAISHFADLFDNLLEEKAVAAIRAGEVLARIITALRRKGFDLTKISLEQWEDLLRGLGNGKIFREGLFDFLKNWSKKPTSGFTDMLGEYSIVPADENTIAERVSEAIQYAYENVQNDIEKRIKVAMGEAMQSLAGKCAGEMVYDRIRDNMINDISC
ncbi:MAG: Glu-tRNA(Gln) amidotransferase subunit GatE [Candidatus Electryonea clarkiae]|nr:Glu-tRNA(Gln) amidotransferase subunit GatE [Candidatus Electryonea clarkiae]MDP8287098.1 Glu-tRNA(Gln) amidotransferase subunit GatE [Candidatus Electryonea clarkiae]